MSDLVSKYDDLLQEDGPAAIVIKRKLLPIEGAGAWIFPPTFAASESDDDEEGGGGDYNIDELGDGLNVCLIDSIGSQANRMEPVFKQPPYDKLVPQVLITLKEGNQVNLLDAGHRAADAVVRFSKEIGRQLRDAFEELRKTRDCTKLARLAPTSLVFGVWDSRGTQVKSPRLVRSVLRAYNVKRARRSATYRASAEFTEIGAIDSEIDKGTGKQNPLSQEGFKFSLATRTHGGVVVGGDIVQEALLNLVSLRSLTGNLDQRRYLLGLCLVALSYRTPNTFNLREGCLLKAASPDDADGIWNIEYVDGRKGAHLKLKHFDALQFAEAAASAFQVVNPPPDVFDKETAEGWLKLDKASRKKLGKNLHPQDALKVAVKKIAAKRKGASAEEEGEAQS